MLQSLYVKNVALISETEIVFDSGVNVLSGETGSGKSVILESINFVLGSKADKTMIRYGEQEATVRAEFLVDENSAAANVLRDYDIDCDGTITISRRFNTEGRGGIKINGAAVTVAMLKSVTQRLVDVHGQSEHFFLLDEANQLKVIDGILGSAAEKIKKELSLLISEKREINKKIAQIGGNEAEREQRLDILGYQIKEIEQASLQEGEFERLTARQKLIDNTERILTALSSARAALSDDNGSIDGVTTAKHCLNSVSSLSEDYSKLFDRLDSLYLEMSDISECLSDFCGELSFDSREAEEIDSRITLIKSLFKKYGSDETQVLNFCQKAREQYNLLSDGADAVEKYNKKIADCNNKIYGLCKKLTDLRKTAAEKFSGSVIEELKSLNIPSAEFSVNFETYDENSAELNNSDGSDNICFMFSANKGEPQKPMSKVISGGEASRFMLAVKTVLKDVNGISTYIFDEIDAGISGRTANTVAEKFINIAQNTQVIVVSHLAQVCAAGDSHYLIYKEETGGKTVTKVKKLDEQSKIEEIVRLTGSLNTVAAREHAAELVNQFKK